MTIQYDADGHRTTGHDANPTTLAEAESNLRDAINMGCTDNTHDHVRDYRNALLNAAVDTVYGMAAKFRSCDDEYPEEWSSRDVRDAVETAGDAVKGMTQ